MVLFALLEVYVLLLKHLSLSIFLRLLEFCHSWHALKSNHKFQAINIIWKLLSNTVGVMRTWWWASNLIFEKIISICQDFFVYVTSTIFFHGKSFIFLLYSIFEWNDLISIYLLNMTIHLAPWVPESTWRFSQEFIILCIKSICY